MPKMKMGIGPDLVTLKSPITWDGKKNDYTHGIIVAPHDMSRGKLISVDVYPFNPETGEILIGEDGKPQCVDQLIEDLRPFKVETPGKKPRKGKRGSGKDGGDADNAV